MHQMHVNVFIMMQPMQLWGKKREKSDGVSPPCDNSRARMRSSAAHVVEEYHCHLFKCCRSSCAHNLQRTINFASFSFPPNGMTFAIMWHTFYKYHWDCVSRHMHCVDDTKMNQPTINCVVTRCVATVFVETLESIWEQSAAASDLATEELRTKSRRKLVWLIIVCL